MRGYPLHRVLARRAAFLGEARAAGRALALDREEGYNFVRRRALVTLADGRRARAWIYDYRGPRERAVPPRQGDARRAPPASP